MLLEILKDLPSRITDPAFPGIIMQHAQELIDADRCSLFLVDEENQELWANPGKHDGREKEVKEWGID